MFYVNAFGNGFVLDDTRLIATTCASGRSRTSPHLFVSSCWGTEGAQSPNRAAPLATYAVNYAIDGLSTYGYTAVNLALHVSVSLLLMTLVRALGGSILAAGIAGVLFAVHPVHTEAVTGLSGRPELLAAFFFLLALLLHRRAPAAGPPARRSRAGVLACFACALLSKESAITLLAVIPAMDVIVPARAHDGASIGGVRGS